MRRRGELLSDDGQAMAEFALVMPLFTALIFGIITLGIGVFYQQQLTNAAREAARYAAIHSATAQCPVVPTRDPASPPLTYTRCDRPQNGWPLMTAHARSAVFGIDRSRVNISACWSGYQLSGGAIDAPPPGTYDIGGVPTTISSTFVRCLIDSQDPTAAGIAAIRCQTGLPTTDEASAISEAQGRAVANTVTAYACYDWRPPLAGFLVIPSQLTLRAVITEALERQQ